VKSHLFSHWSRGNELTRQAISYCGLSEDASSLCMFFIRIKFLACADRCRNCDRSLRSKERAIAQRRAARERRKSACSSTNDRQEVKS
jgi:hypothetical protein